MLYYGIRSVRREEGERSLEESRVLKFGGPHRVKRSQCIDFCPSSPADTGQFTRKVAEDEESLVIIRPHDPTCDILLFSSIESITYHRKHTLPLPMALRDSRPS